MTALNHKGPRWSLINHHIYQYLSTFYYLKNIFQTESTSAPNVFQLTLLKLKIKLKSKFKDLFVMFLMDCSVGMCRYIILYAYNSYIQKVN